MQIPLATLPDFDALAKAPARPAPLALLGSEDLAASASVPSGVQLAKRRDLPRIEDVLTKLKAAHPGGLMPEASESESDADSPDRVEVAQAGLPGASDSRAPSAGFEAQSALESANASRDGRNYTAAALGYFDVTNRFGGGIEDMLADEYLLELVTGVFDGSVPAQALADFEAQLPAYESLSVHGKYGLVSYFGAKFEEADIRGLDESPYLQDCIDYSRGFIVAHPDSPLQISAVDYYYDAVVARGGAALDEGAAYLESLLGQGDGENAASPRTFAIHDVLVSYYGKERRNMALAGHHAGQVAALADLMAQYFDDPHVYFWTKGWIALAAGRSCDTARLREEAVAWYDRGLEAMPAEIPRESATKNWLGLRRAEVIAKINVGDPYAGILAYDEYLNTQPHTQLADRALLAMGGLYMQAHDYQQAAAYYQAVATEYRGTVQGNLAQRELDFVMQHLYDGWPVASIESTPDGPAPTKRAQLCGPTALQKLLKTRGVESTVEELARLSQCTETETTMWALAEAAAQKGELLIGVRAGDVRQIEAPFIAHVDGDHFVLVTERDGSNVVVADVGDRVERMPLGAFEARWNGRALVADDAPAVAELLDADGMRMARGGHSEDSSFDIGCDPETCEDPPPPPPSTPCGGSPTGTGDTVGVPGCNQGSSDPGTCTISECGHSPTAWVGITSPGINAHINMFTSTLILGELDVAADMPGPLRMGFYRSFENDGFMNDTDGRIGVGWAQNNNQGLGAVQGTIYYSQVLTYEENHEYWMTLTTTMQGYGPFGQWFSRIIQDGQYGDYEATQGGGVSAPEFLAYRINGTLYGYTMVSSSAGGALTYPYPGWPISVGISAWYRLTTITDKTGNTLVLEYDDETGLITNWTWHSWDSQNQDPRSLVYTYSGGRISKVALNDGQSDIYYVEYYYDATTHELIRVRYNGDDAKDIVYTYDSDANVPDSRFLSSVTDMRNYTTYFDYEFEEVEEDVFEVVEITVSRPDGGTGVYSRSATSGVGVSLSLDGETTLAKRGNTPVTGNWALSSSKDNYLGPNFTTYERWAYTYNANGKPLTTVMPDGTTVFSENQYDQYGRLYRVRTGTGPWTTFGYADAQAKYANSITGPDGLVTAIDYDVKGRIENIAHPAAPAGTTYTYDNFGDVGAVTDALSNTTVFAYDDMGNVESVTDPTDRTVEFDYDEQNRVTNARQVSQSGDKETTYAYVDGGCGGCGSGGQLESVTDAASNVTEFDYDLNGNMTVLTDGLDRETHFAYDGMNRLTTITSAPGTALEAEMSFTYDKLGQMISVTDYEGAVTSYEYDHMGRVVKVVDPASYPNAYVQVTYEPTGAIETVTDQLGHTTTYTYDTAFRLTQVEDEIGKKVKYFYDTAGRLTSVGAGADGSVDPTDYAYDATTGLLETVTYNAGENVDVLEYVYDAGARLTQLLDWIDDTNGIQYAYDDAGRIVSITDYDGESLEYAYDDYGNVATMTNDFGNVASDTVFSYTYTATNQLDTISAPGSRVWDFSYNALGQVTQYTHPTNPSGLVTQYTYDARNRLSSIMHKDGETVLLPFEYELDDVGNITKIEEKNGFYWDYGYDGRYRLASAKFHDGTKTRWNESYTYDGGDNMLTKDQPWFDTFEDGVNDGWGVWAGTWTAADGYLQNTSSSGGSIKINTTVADHELWFSYRRDSSSSSGVPAVVHMRYDTASQYTDQLRITISPGQMALEQKYNNTWTTLDTEVNADTTDDTWYDVYVKCDGANVQVWRAESGEALEQVLSTSSAASMSTTVMPLWALANSYWAFDDFAMLDEDGEPIKTYTYTVNNANELTAMSDGTTTTNFTYDDWGRQTSKYTTSYDADYEYRYSHKLASVTSNFPGEGAVDYLYGGDGKRRARTAGAEETWYNWDRDFTVLSEEDDALGNGDLLRKYVAGTAAYIDGLGPLDVVSHVLVDHLGSSREVRSSASEETGDYAYGSYGEQYSHGGITAPHTYTGHTFEPGIGVYYTAFRQYSPESSRWTARDPIGFLSGINRYSYVAGRPCNAFDPLGLQSVGVPGPNQFAVDCGSASKSTQISFRTPKDANCDSVDFIQIVKTDKWGIDSPKWHVDRREENMDRFPYYPFPPSGHGNLAMMEDHPVIVPWWGGTQSFQTCAVCRKGKEKGKIYGCVSWSATYSFGNATYSGCGIQKPKNPTSLFVNVLVNDVRQDSAGTLD